MNTVVSSAPVGTHWFTAYEGDVEYVEDPDTGLSVVANPVVYASPKMTNMIMTAGKNAYLNQLAGLTTTPFTYVGVGTDSTAPAASQTALNPSVTGSVLIQAADSGFPTVSTAVLTIQSTFGTAVANFTWAEAGIFNGLTNGTSIMFNRLNIGPFTKTNTVSIVYSSTITQD